MGIENRRITFKSDGRALVGQLRLPDGFAENQQYPSVVIVGPGSSVKEQAGGFYAEKLAAKGYLTLVFDPSFQGESEGFPRDTEDPAARVEDIRCAVDFLVTLPFVDEEAIGLLGICAGGGYAINAALIERRFKAVGTVVANDLGSAWRRSQPQASAVEDALAAVAKQRTLEARGGSEKRDDWLPSPAEAKAAGIKDPSLLNAIDYYATPRPSRAPDQPSPVRERRTPYRIRRLSPCRGTVGSAASGYRRRQARHDLFARGGTRTVGTRAQPARLRRDRRC